MLTAVALVSLLATNAFAVGQAIDLSMKRRVLAKDGRSELWMEAANVLRGKYGYESPPANAKRSGVRRQEMSSSPLTSLVRSLV